MGILQRKLEKTKVAFLTVVFRENEVFLNEFLKSLNCQSFQNFDLIVVNDGLDNFEYYKKKFPNLRIKELSSTYSHIKNREVGINYCIEKKYDFLVFGDSDDYFKNDRIEKSIKLLKSYDIVVNDLSTFNSDGSIDKMYLSNRLRNHQEINYNFIKNKNIFGLSNTSIKLKKLNKMKLPEDVIALDWFIFSCFLIEGKSAIFTNNTISYYRQHSSNVIGLKKLDTISYKKGLITKNKHYNALKRKFNMTFNDINKCEIKKTQFPLWWEQIFV